MCLSVRSHVKPRATGIGWKVFRNDGGALRGIICDGGPLPVKTWLIAKGRTREAGFHIYKNRSDATKRAGLNCTYYVMRRVLYRRAYLQGKGDGGWNNAAPVVIAKEMYISK